MLTTPVSCFALVCFAAASFAICRSNVVTGWSQLASLNLQGSFTRQVQHELQCNRQLGPPPLSESDWQLMAHNSLAAALQYHIWPTDQTSSGSQAQVTSVTLAVSTNGQGAKESHCK